MHVFNVCLLLLAGACSQSDMAKASEGMGTSFASCKNGPQTLELLLIGETTTVKCSFDSRTKRFLREMSQRS